MRHDDKFSDRIHIEALEIFARVGVPEEERASEQRLVLNLTFWPTHPEAPLNDELARTVDYSAVSAETKRFVKTRSDRLIETLADALAMHLLQIFAIQKITIELRKFILPEVEFVSVTVTRTRAARVRKTQISGATANPKSQARRRTGSLWRAPKPKESSRHQIPGPPPDGLAVASSKPAAAPDGLRHGESQANVKIKNYKKKRSSKLA